MRLILLAAVASGSELPTAGFQQCDRECRFKFGFYDRNITGVRIGALKHNDSWGRFCRCYRQDNTSEQVVISESIPRVSHKPWDDAEFWCGAGNGTDPGFDTDYVCALNSTGLVHTTTRAAASAKGEAVVHCGRCAACSHPSDVRVLYDTRRFITTEMTRCAAKFAKPSILGGDRSLADLRKCFRDAKISFDEARRFAGSGPTCMECWTDNIQCDSSQCSTDPSCIAKFINPNNTGAFAGCLRCDENHCGAEFIRFARPEQPPPARARTLCSGTEARIATPLTRGTRPASQVRGRQPTVRRHRLRHRAPDERGLPTRLVLAVLAVPHRLRPGGRGVQPEVRDPGAGLRRPTGRLVSRRHVRTAGGRRYGRRARMRRGTEALPAGPRLALARDRGERASAPCSNKSRPLAGHCGRRAAGPGLAAAPLRENNFFCIIQNFGVRVIAVSLDSRRTLSTVYTATGVSVTTKWQLLL